MRRRRQQQQHPRHYARSHAPPALSHGQFRLAYQTSPTTTLRVAVKVPATATAAASHILLLAFAFVTRSDCLKIRNIPDEFEELQTSETSPYSRWDAKEFRQTPVAIVGAHEYILSENIGILGDLAAGRKQTFGTLFARSLAWIGGKLHYGHPDFLNVIYMTTRGGVSKAQKGLHLNKDIYAEKNVFGWGGRIRHTEYFQCGNGRDLEFGTILDCQRNIGTGMGEQMLSREYDYFGTPLAIDRLLTLYYGRPGFHINNMLAILSVQVFIVTLVFVATLTSSITIWKYTSSGQFISGHAGCYNLANVSSWIHRSIISIFFVFIRGFYFFCADLPGGLPLCIWAAP
ncbi:unnamed protein product [Mycena citricolor]|uniref:Glycosyl transferase 48 domain-containing protein n=1 Tax=Mycena citricolor TaxID=2018698 RepID=A0AAD2GUK2_9AGAR|nr:unnamed protein product [Mycena citricolor]